MYYFIPGLGLVPKPSYIKNGPNNEIEWHGVDNKEGPKQTSSPHSTLSSSSHPSFDRYGSLYPTQSYNQPTYLMQSWHLTQNTHHG
mmetsp:Transcript_14456/g.16418  ORF Transcript_14456/g.16418 Transcript_14456/m.16418 type:complete len:86 (+) Transcript_14456:32-289(+)